VKTETHVPFGASDHPDQDGIGGVFNRLWPVDEASCFSSVPQVIDAADENA
jgi:hypothetical protein